MAENTNTEREAFVQWMISDVLRSATKPVSDEMHRALRQTAERVWDSGEELVVRGWQARASLSLPAAGQEPMFWVRLCGDGLYEGPIHNARIEEVRRQSGAWSPLYLAAAPQPAAPYSIDADPQGIRATVADAITGALAFGAQGVNPPPEGHWLAPFWNAARADKAAPQPAAQVAGQEPVAYVDERAIAWLANARAQNASITTTLGKTKSFERPMALCAAPQPAVAAGWVMVPKESTAAMQWAFARAETRYQDGAGRWRLMDHASAFKSQYAAMLAAAPQPPAVNPTRQLLAQVDPATGSIVGYFSDEKPPFPQPTVTAGAVDALVPIEPTETMWEAFDQYNGDKYTGHSTWLTAWSAMLKAAPQPTPSPAPAQPGQEGEPAGRFMDEADERKSAKEGYEKRITRVSERNPNDEGMYTLGWWDRAWKAAARAAPQPATADAVDCSGGSPCSTCPDKKKCSRGCVRQGGRA